MRLEENIHGFKKAEKLAKKNGWKIVKTIPANASESRRRARKFNEGLGDSIKHGWNKIKSGAKKVGHIIGRYAMMQPKGDHIEIWNAKYLSKDEAKRANSFVMSGKIVLSSSIDGKYIFEIDGDIDSSVKVGDWMDFQNIDTRYRERGMGYVEKIDGNKLYLRTDKDMLSETRTIKESDEDNNSIPCPSCQGTNIDIDSDGNATCLDCDYSWELKDYTESIDADPALVCPYCGGNNCEVSIGTDDLNLTELDRL